MPDWLTCTGFPSVSALSPPYGEEAATAADDYDPDEPPRGRPSDNRDALRVAVDALRAQLERERRVESRKACMRRFNYPMSQGRYAETESPSC